ncbi:hypothetical protein N8Z32_02030 [Ascidiaceihabitans sp.]|nr:hypothetical protein [Ascidiaceihabitans sp.]
MANRLLGALVISGMMGACTPVPIVLEGEVDLNIVKNNQAKQKTTVVAEKPKVPEFKYISTLTLSVGPCPKRDVASYGLLLKSRTKVENSRITCYYN